VSARGWGLALLLLAATGSAACAGEAPNRVAVAGSGLTEIVHALGAADRLVAVDTTSQFPTRVRAHAQIGYLRALSAEGILSVRPDLLLVSEDAGPPAALARLADAGLPLLRVQEGYAPEAILKRIAAVGDALGQAEAARAVQADFAADISALRDAVARLERRPRVLFVLSAGSAAPLAAGRETAAAAIVELAGASNAIDAYRGYKPLAPEALALVRPDFVLTSDQTAKALGGIDAMRAMPVFAGLPNRNAVRFVSFDSVYLLGFGPRTAHAARDLAKALHPGAALPDLPARAWTLDAP